VDDLLLVRCPDASEWLNAATPILLRHEAENNLLFGVADQITRGLYSRAAVPYLAVLKEGAEVVGAILRTPPHNVLLSHDFPLRGLHLVPGDLVNESEKLFGVLATADVSRGFARVWNEFTGDSHRLEMHMRIFRARSVTFPAGVEGRFRRAEERDRRLLSKWVAAFIREALGKESDPGTIERSLDSALRFEAGGLFVWDCGGLMSMAAYEGPTPNGIRLNAVYTPPAQRGNGYASACVAHLTRWLLDKGKDFVFLFTDLANPTSNKIYTSVGYRAVCDVDEYRIHADP
jgi:predicted GNAT family acetyltransferase